MPECTVMSWTTKMLFQFVKIAISCLLRIQGAATPPPHCHLAFFPATFLPMAFIFWTATYENPGPTPDCNCITVSTYCNCITISTYYICIRIVTYCTCIRIANYCTLLSDKVYRIYHLSIYFHTLNVIGIGLAMGHSPIQHKKGPLTNEIAILNIEIKNLRYILHPN